MKAADYGTATRAVSAFVATNSICQGQQVPILWPLIFATSHVIAFAHTSFKWANLASYNAGVTVIIVAVGRAPMASRSLFSTAGGVETQVRFVDNINAYLVAAPNVEVAQARVSQPQLAPMVRGNMPYDGGNLLLSTDEAKALDLPRPQRDRFLRKNYGGAEFIRGQERYCLWIEDEHLEEALAVPKIATRIEAVKEMRLASPDAGANAMAANAHQMREMNIGRDHAIVVAAISSENRPFIPCGLIDNRTTVNNKNYVMYDAPLWNMALVASRLHWVWIGTVCVRLEMRFSYSNTLGWNTFPVPTLTEQNKADLTRCAEDILLAREAHFPATIADLYDTETMPDNLRRAHEANDEVLERIYIGRRFKNDTERLEKLFELYTKMTSRKAA